ncbi:MAG TPA: sulfotransferase [Steroidobacteraceae bacterium]|nr:sulfotransferase [Steroidobacteraceae bacterium]
MILQWFDANQAAKIGVELADQFAPQPAPAAAHGIQSAPREQGDGLHAILQRADREVRTLRLNFYKKAKFANAFKWRLIENGVEPAIADEATQSLILHLSQDQPMVAATSDSAPHRLDTNKTQHLLDQGNKCLTESAFAQAVVHYQELLELQPRNPEALCNLGVALFSLGRYQEAERCYRQSLEINPMSAETLCNLAAVLHSNSREAEKYLRRALKINPKYADARSKLGMVLIFAGRVREAKAACNKALKVDSRQAEALLGLGLIARTEGRFEEAESFIKRALKVAPKLPGAWAAMNSLRKMTNADSDWLKGAEEIAGSAIPLWQEAELRFAIGKYCDDVDDFERAFQNFRRANELQRTMAQKYDRQAHSTFADGMIRSHSREAMSRAADYGSASVKPVFVLGMPRSGTSLVEQIVASHPSAKGAGELQFWLDTGRANQGELREGMLGESVRKKLAEDYLRVLALHGSDALRVIDKAVFNCDYLGLVHSVFPKARIIYMRRDPIDTCLSCYFQNFSGLGFTMDLSDLADYYRVHRRLMNHWVTSLPSGTILEVPYEELVADQAAWTHRILDFLELEWDDRCLSFDKTERPVNTASAWQVRQKIYNRSVQRWRHYEKFIGPLKGLRA